MKPALFALVLLSCPALADVPTGTQIVLLGEVHDNADAHLGQAEIIASIKPTAVVFEMLSPEDAAAIDADRGAIADIWDETFWPDFALYSPIFDALGEARIVGMAVPRETNRAVFTDGPLEAFGPDAARFGLDRPLPADQQAIREALQFEAHCEAMPVEMMGAMVDVQRFWDASFARTALEALADHGAPVAVVLGNGHARTDWGVPAAIAQAAPEITTHALGFVESDAGMPFDVLRMVPPAQRDDPCGALRQD